MKGKDDTNIRSLRTMQLIAIIAIVIGHFWMKDGVFMNSTCVIFTFVYSGFFTALRHEFGTDYSLRDHLKFMWGKIAKLYPLHILGILLGSITIRTVLNLHISLKVILAHITLLSSWIPYSDYFFGMNPVAWYICDLFFLYLIAPFLVKGLRKIPLVCQILMIVALIIIEFLLEYKSLLGSYHLYFIYQFPIIRILDFATGIIIFNLTRHHKCQELKSNISDTLATIIETGSIIAFAILFFVGKHWIHTYCYRGFCASAPAIVALFVPFILTSGHNGLISRLLQFRIFSLISVFGAEIYLLQFSPYFVLGKLFEVLGITPPVAVYFLVQMAALFLLAWAAHRWYVTPLNKLLIRMTPPCCQTQ